MPLSDLYLTSTSSRPPLRVGLLLDDFQVLRFFEQIVADIQKSEVASIELAIVKQPQQAPVVQRAPFPVRVWRILREAKRRKHLLYHWYSRFDSKKNPVECNPLDTIDIEARLGNVPRLYVDPIAKGFTHRFSPSDIAQIRAHRLDVLLRFGFNILRGEILTSATYGVWSYHHGDNDYYRGGPPLFWELVEDSETSGVVLQVLTEELDAGKVLCKSVFSSRRGLSLLQNQYGPYLGSTHMVIRKLHELHEQGWDKVLAKSVPAAPYQGKRKLYRTPGNGEMVRWLAPAVASKVARRWTQRPAVCHWRIGIRSRGAAVEEALRSGTAALPAEEYRWLEAPQGRFWADPFLFEQEGKTWLFFEDYSYAKGFAGLSAVRLTDDGAIDGEVVSFLDRPFHLSYPCVFKADGEVFLIPESGADGSVQLFRCTRFPFEWKLEKVLYRGRCVDTTPWFQDARWWFFTTVSEPRGYAVHSMLFSAATLTGEWTPHPANPFCADVRYSRNGGAILPLGKKLYRVSQNCAGHYGKSTWLNEIKVLDPLRYEETPVLEMTPGGNGNRIGSHTYNVSSRFEVIDVASYEPLSAHT